MRIPLRRLIIQCTMLFYLCCSYAESNAKTILQLLLLGEIFGMNDLKDKLSFAKKERIDKQYYVSDPESMKLSEEAAGKMLTDAEDFTLKIKSFLGRIKTGEAKDYQKTLQEKIKRRVGKLY